MSASKPNCLIVLSSSKEGVSSQSFIQTFSLTQVAFNVQIATPGGKYPEFVNQQDEQTHRWLSDFRTKSFSIPIGLQAVDANRYSCLIIPHSPGAVVDLAQDAHLAQVMVHFIREKKPICAVGMGVAALFCVGRDDGNGWEFKNYSLTSSSVFELARLPNFSELSIVPEDVLKDRGALYAASEPDAVHVVVDRHLITGQNEPSTITAVQNLILMCNQKQNKVTGKQP